MRTSNYPDHSNHPSGNLPGPMLAWRIFRYLLVHTVLGAFRLGWWLLTRSVLFCLGCLRLMASPASSGRSQDEFKDLVQLDSPDGQAPRGDGSDGFWRIYLQAYSPRLWRMRRLLPMSTGKVPNKDDRQDQE